MAWMIFTRNVGSTTMDMHFGEDWDVAKYAFIKGKGWDSSEIQAFDACDGWRRLREGSVVFHDSQFFCAMPVAEMSYIERMLASEIFKEEYPAWLGGAVVSYIDEMSKMMKMEYMDIIEGFEIHPQKNNTVFGVRLLVPGGVLCHLFKEGDYSGDS